MGKPLKEFYEWTGLPDHTEAGGSISSNLKSDIKSAERGMLDQLNRLTIDEKTGLPVLPEYQEDIETAKTLKKQDVLGITKGVDPTAESYKKLFASGVTKHGRTERFLKDTSKEFKNQLDAIDTNFKSQLGKAETDTLARLDEIKYSIEDVETERGRASSGSNYRNLGVGILGKSKASFGSVVGPENLYEVESLDGTKDVKEVERDMYAYDYLTGKRKTT